MTDFLTWLRFLGLDRYAQVFADNDVDLDALRLLSEKDLQELGVSLGHRKKLLKAVAELADSPKAKIKRQRAKILSPQSRDTKRQMLEVAAERRQLTVMFIDMVDSTALSARLDPEDLRNVVQQYQQTCTEVIQRYDGHIAQYLGDGILVYFGYPRAHEDEAVRAVRAGLEIIQALQFQVPSPRQREGQGEDQLHVRIGIHTGLVVVGEIGDGSRHEQLALGETPNLAARIQGVAAPDTVVISAATCRLVQGLFEYQDVSAQSLKGISAPLTLYRVVRESGVQSRFEAATQTGLTPLVGREHELAMLLERWQLAQDGEGQVVLLSGEPGIGKSRIVSALWERLEGQGVRALRFQCSPYYVNSALYPIIDNFERTLKFGRDETADSKLDKLEVLVVTHYGQPLTDVRFLAAMLLIPCEERYRGSALTPQKHKDETLRSLVDLIEAAARKHPTVMVFEDAHWADPTSLEMLDLLIDRVQTTPLLLVLTHRPEFQSHRSRHGHVTELNLSKLTRAQSAVIVAKLTSGKALAKEAVQQIVSKTDGVPLFVEELTKAVLESVKSSESQESNESPHSTPLQLAIPATLQDALMARLDRLGAAKEIAQIGAAIGREFRYTLLAAVTSIPKPALDRALEHLTDSGLVFRRGTPPEATYTFKHALVQDAAYGSLLKSRRQELHATIARVLAADFPQITTTEPELLAHHLTAAGQTATAIPFWQQAGMLALKRFALNEAIAHLSQGIKIIGTLPQSPDRDRQELDLRIPLGTAWIALKGWGAPELWTSLQPALELAKSFDRHDALLPIYYGLWTSVLVQGRIVESLDGVNNMLATAEVSGDPDLLLVAQAAACTTRYFLGDFTQSHVHGGRVLALYNEEQHRHLADLLNRDPKTTARIFVSLGTWMLGYLDRAVQVSEACITHARWRGHPFDLGFALAMHCLIFDFRCDPEQTLAYAAEAEGLGRTHSLTYISDVLAQVMKGIAWLRAGRLAEGIPQLQGALETFNAHGVEISMPYYRAVLAEGLALSGDLARGLRLIEEGLAQIARPGWEERWYLAEILRLKGWMLTLQGDLEGAEQNYLASLDWARQQQAKSWELRTATSLARLWQQQDKVTEAHILLSEIYNWFTEGFETKDLQEAKVLLERIT